MDDREVRDAMKDERGEQGKDMTISDIIEDVKNRICDDYCKYPDKYGAEEFDDMIAEKCEDCPLGRLL